ncbi:hypothetical protein OAH18_02245, partial [bacterium]|nr:hypothetical protein [bacterium]
RLWLLWLACCAAPFGWILTLAAQRAKVGPALAIIPAVVVAWLLAGSTVLWIKRRRKAPSRFDPWLVILVWTPCAILGICIWGDLILNIVIGILRM